MDLIGIEKSDSDDAASTASPTLTVPQDLDSQKASTDVVSISNSLKDSPEMQEFDSHEPSSPTLSPPYGDDSPGLFNNIDSSTDVVSTSSVSSVKDLSGAEKLDSNEPTQKGKLD